MDGFWASFFSANRKTHIMEYAHARHMRRSFGWRTEDRLMAARKSALYYSERLRAAS